MRNNVTFLRPFVWIDSEGYSVPPHIIAFGRRGIEFRGEDMGNGMIRAVVSKYCYELEVNLYFVVMFFTWTHPSTNN